MTHRIEITFVGDGPDSELHRARILAAQPVTECIEALTMALNDAGLSHEVRVTVTRSVPARRNGRGRAVPHEARPQAAE